MEEDGEQPEKHDSNPAQHDTNFSSPWQSMCLESVRAAANKASLQEEMAEQGSVFRALEDMVSASKHAKYAGLAKTLKSANNKCRAKITR